MGRQRRPSAAAATAAAAAAALAVLAMLPGAAGHGYMSLPASRNFMHSTFYPRTAAERDAIPESYWDYCPHCLAAGGPGRVSNSSSLVWPAGLNGLCGDMYYVNGEPPDVDTGRDHEAGGRFATEEVGGVYEEGSAMEIRIGITAHHNGRFGFRICRILAPGPGQTWAQAEKAQLTNDCFNQYILVQANVTGAQAPNQQHSFLPYKPWLGYNFDLTPPIYSYYYTVPDGLRCDGVVARCVLQWHWVTGNSCTPPGTPSKYAEPSINQCGPTAPYPEEFWNCADVRTTPRNGAPSPPPSPPSPPRPPLMPPPSPRPPSPPSPPATVNPCAAADARCFCAWKKLSGTFADTNGGCKGFFQCVPGITAYKTCGLDTLYDDLKANCNFASQVSCAATMYPLTASPSPPPPARPPPTLPARPSPPPARPPPPASPSPPPAQSPPASPSPPTARPPAPLPPTPAMRPPPPLPTTPPPRPLPPLPTTPPPPLPEASPSPIFDYEADYKPEGYYYGYSPPPPSTPPPPPPSPPLPPQRPTPPPLVRRPVRGGPPPPPARKFTTVVAGRRRRQ